MKIIPVGDSLVVEIIEDETKGLAIAESGKEAPNKGRITEVGPSCGFEVGSTVLFEKYSGCETTIEGRNITILKKDDILVILKED